MVVAELPQQKGVALASNEGLRVEIFFFEILVGH